MHKRLAFHPTWTAVGKALLSWALLFGAAAIVFFGGLLAGSYLLHGPEYNPPPPSGVSSLNIYSDQETIRLAGKSLDCGPAGVGYRCTAIVDDEPLVVSITPGDWQAVCAATYAGDVVPCRTSWNNTRPYAYYAIIEDDLGLAPERFAELAAQNAGSGWQESDWLRLRAGFVAFVGLASAIWLWVGTRMQAREDRRLLAVRGAYTAGVTLLIVGFVWLTSVWTLLALNVID